MSNPDIEIRKFVRRIDLYAARLNPGLAAVAIILAVFLLGEISLRYEAFYVDMVASDDLRLTSDQTAFVPIYFAPSNKD